MSWTKNTLQALVEAQPSWVVDAAGECLTVSNDEGIDAFIYAGQNQIVAETALFPASSVSDAAALNALILRSHQLVPLTTIGINNIGGDDYYVAFGSLSVDSKESVVVEEIETLFDNVTEFLDLFSEYLLEEQVA